MAFATLATAQTPVILISIDTLRADHVGVYGSKTVPTPNIDSFATGGTVFPNVDCQTPLTLPSHTSLFTSTYPFANGIQENAEQIPPNAVTLAGVLKSHGYKTAAFVSTVFLEKEMGLDKGFDTYDSPFNFAAFSPVSGEMFFGGPPNLANVRDRRDGALTVHAALRWLAAHNGQPVFLFVHLFDLHTPYSLPERSGISRYDAQLELEDEFIGRLKKALLQNGWWDKSLTILLSDHGEGLGDHGERSHGYFVYESTLHVPLIIHWPSGHSAQPQLTGLMDVAPMILDYLQFPIPPSFEGQSRVAHPVYSETMHTHDSFGWSPLRAIRIGNEKYIEAPKPELYDLAKDPTEQHNLIKSEPARAQALRAQLGKILASHSHAESPGSTNPQTEKLLSSLGYLGRGPETHRKAEADPKDRLPEFYLYEKAIEKVGDRNLNGAIVLLKQVLAQDPTNTLARRDLASCYLDLHAYADARVNFMQVVKAAPQDYPSQFGLGLAAKHLRIIAEARSHLESACGLAPQATQCQTELSDLLRSGGVSRDVHHGVVGQKP